MDVAEERQCGGARRGDEWPAELAFRGNRTSLRAARQTRASEDSDPESRIMQNADGKDIGKAYKCQVLIDSGQQVIVAGHAAA